MGGTSRSTTSRERPRVRDVDQAPEASRTASPATPAPESHCSELRAKSFTASRRTKPPGSSRSNAPLPKPARQRSGNGNGCSPTSRTPPGVLPVETARHAASRREEASPSYAVWSDAMTRRMGTGRFGAGRPSASVVGPPWQPRHSCGIDACRYLGRGGRQVDGASRVVASPCFPSRQYHVDQCDSHLARFPLSSATRRQGPVRSVAELRLTNPTRKSAELAG